MSHNDIESKNTFISELGVIVRELVEYRELLYQITLRDIRIRYKQAVMGLGWAVFMPILIILSGCIVRLAMASLGGSAIKLTEIAGIAVKALPWAFFVGAVGFANTSLVNNANLVTKVYFPREVLPLSAVLAQGFDTAIGGCALALILPFLGAEFSPALCWLPLLAIILFLFTGAVGLFVSCANLFFRDVKYIVQVGLTFGIFFTPVFFEPQMFGPRGAELMMLNPLAPILEGIRLTITDSHNLLQPLSLVSEGGAAIRIWSPFYLLYSSIWAFVGFIGAAFFFHRMEFVFAEYA